MSKQRFRDIKQKKIKNNKEIKNIENKNTLARDYATARIKIKAFLTDTFMLLMPIMYIVFYLIMGGRDGFSENMILGWIYILIPLVIVQTIFMFKTAQTPGYRAYNIKLIDEKTGKKPSLFIIFFRNISAILSMFSFIGWIIMFIRKDKKTLHDLLSGTATIMKYETK